MKTPESRGVHREREETQFERALHPSNMRLCGKIKWLCMVYIPNLIVIIFRH